METYKKYLNEAAVDITKGLKGVKGNLQRFDLNAEVGFTILAKTENDASKIAVKLLKSMKRDKIVKDVSFSIL